jgi:hypothetical protein
MLGSGAGKVARAEEYSNSISEYISTYSVEFAKKQGKSEVFSRYAEEFSEVGKGTSCAFLSTCLPAGRSLVVEQLPSLLGRRSRPRHLISP